MSTDRDAQVRLAAFQFLDTQRVIFGDSLPRQVLSQGFPFDGQRVPLVGPAGIFKPAVLREVPISITTAPEVPGKMRPYEDQISPEGTILSRYRGTDPSHSDNVGLRRALYSKFR